MKTLTKLLTREHSLFYFQLWHDMDAASLKKWLGFNVKNGLFLKEDKSNKVSSWYEVEELAKIYKTESLVFANSTQVKKVTKQFFYYWKLLWPYYQNKKQLKNLAELKVYYNNWAKWWSAMAIIFDSVDLADLPAKTRAKFLAIRQKTQEYSELGDRVWLNFFQKAFPQYKKIANVLRPTEVFSLAKAPFDKKTIKQIAKRQSGYGLFHNQILTLSELKKEMVKNDLAFEELKVKTQDIITGMPASRGVGKGRARVILYKKDINKVRRGEVLVTDMTSPDFAPVLARVVAIVTDEGGLTCHAAIVARELKKPCIVGTKIATQVLKDGDLVEVNADKGIVKIVKRVK